MGINVGDTIILERDTPAVLIPAGTPVNVPEGTEVKVTQALGGSVTLNIHGNLVRIEGKDADALGIDPEELSAKQPEDPDDPLTEEKVWEALKQCYDPEIPVNIVELGLIYELSISKNEDGGNHVYVEMTLTAPGCGMGDFLRQDVINTVSAIPGVDSMDVEMTFDPPWDFSRMSEAAKLQLGVL